jgi:flagellar protein FliS
MVKNLAANYQKVQAQTASPGQRVVLVYKAIGKNIQQAINFLSETDPDRFSKVNNSIIQAENLIIELQAALDKENGGEIAENLDDLYIFWRKHLSDGNVKKDPEMLKEVLEMVKDMTESWEEAERQVRTSSGG